MEVTAKGILITCAVVMTFAQPVLLVFWLIYGVVMLAKSWLDATKKEGVR